MIAFSQKHATIGENAGTGKRRFSGPIREAITMSESKDYLVRDVEKGTVNISEEVVAAIAAVAVSEVEGVYRVRVVK